MLDSIEELVVFLCDLITKETGLQQTLYLVDSAADVIFRGIEHQCEKISGSQALKQNSGCPNMGALKALQNPPSGTMTQTRRRSTPLTPLQTLEGTP